MEPPVKTLPEYSDEDLVQLTLELYARSGMYPQSEGLHHAWVEAKRELLHRLTYRRELLEGRDAGTRAMLYHNLLEKETA